MSIQRFSQLARVIAAGILLFTLLRQTTHGAALSVIFSGLPSGSSEDLTADGALDWAHWGLTATNSFDRQAGVINRIGTYGVVGTGVVLQTNNIGVAYSWTNGTPTAAAANSTTALMLTGMNNGFQFQVAADTNLTRLLVFVGARSAQGRMQMHLSDSSVPDFADALLDIASGETNGVYMVDFASATDGQTLTLTFTLQTPHDAGGAVLLHAAALQFGPFNFEPAVTLTNPTNESTYAWPATVMVDAEADDLDGYIREVQFFVNGAPATTATNPPYHFVLAGAPPGAYTFTAVATDNLGGAAVSEPITVFVYTNTGTLNASVTASTDPVNLSAEGTSDWAQWGLYWSSSFNHKFGVEPQIGNYVNLGDVPPERFDDNPVGYSWSEGTPAAAATNITRGVYFTGAGEGCGFSVAADTALRTLKVYVGAYAARGKLRAALTDWSAAPVLDTTVENLDSGPNSVYTIQYRAATPGQLLNVRFTVETNHNDYGNVTLQAATLVTDNVPPWCGITNLAEGAVFRSPTNLLIKVSASDADGSVASVAFFDGTQLLGQDNAAPFEFPWPNVPAGAHRLTALATDNSGKSFTSHPVNFFVTLGGGALAGMRAAPSGVVNLSGEGRTDWAHWGLLNMNSFNHRAAVAQKISDVTKLGGGPLKRLTDYAAGFSWTNGTPTASATNSRTGIFIEGVDHGFQITAPADTALRRLRVFVGAYASRGQFSASLSDASAPDFTDSGVDNVFNNAAGVYTLDYAAASSSNTLTVRFTALENYNLDYGNVTFEAAALSLLAVPLRNPRYAAGQASFEFLSDPGTSYFIQRTDLLPPTNWVTIKSIVGNGATTNIVDPSASGPRNFYRVLSN